MGTGVVAVPPMNTVAPVISGDALEGSTLSTTNGTWTGDPVISFTYQWYRGASPIGSATASMYLLVTADVGENISCEVTGTNGAGSADAGSNSIGPIVGLDPDALAYFLAAEAGGASYLTVTKVALDTFVVGMKSAGLWALVRRWNPMLADGGNVLVGVAVVLNDTVGAAGADTLNNYVAGDWDPASGLQGNGSSTYMDTGWSPLAAQVSTGFLGVCYRGTTITAGTTYLCGATHSDSPTFPQNFYDMGHVSTSVGVAGYHGSTIRVPSTALGTDLNSGIISVRRNGNTDLELYIDNVSLASNNANVTGGGPIQDIPAAMVLGCRRLKPAGAAILQGFLSTSERLAGYIFADGLNGTQRGNLQTLWADFNTAIGR